MMTATKIRLRFAKRGDLRLTSHHDLLRSLERTLRRAAIPMAVSQGFNPRPKIVFAQALGLGIEAEREVVELDLAQAMEPGEVLARLRGAAPPGFEWVEAEAAAPGRAARAEAVQYRVDVPPERREAAREALAQFLSGTSRPYTRHRPDRDVAIDLRPFVIDAELDSLGCLRLRMKVTPNGSARPEEVIDTLGLRDLLAAGAVLVRTEVELAP
jgi:radical SAM-linked protein